MAQTGFLEHLFPSLRSLGSGCLGFLASATSCTSPRLVWLELSFIESQLIRLNRFSTFLYVPTHSTASEVDLCIVRLVHLLTLIHSQYVLIELYVL